MLCTTLRAACIILVVLLVGTGLATEFPSETEVRDIVSGAPGAEEYPEASFDASALRLPVLVQIFDRRSNPLIIMKILGRSFREFRIHVSHDCLFPILWIPTM